ncbi:MAG TPA: hypothetical protein VFZ93_07640 [Albitalea sp.]
MNLIRTTLVAAACTMALAGTAFAQTSGTNAPPSKSEMDRGVPGVDVDVGRNASGAIDVNRAPGERARGVPGVDVDTGRNAQGAVDVDVGSDRARAPRADRN